MYMEDTLTWAHHQYLTAEFRVEQHSLQLFRTSSHDLKPKASVEWRLHLYFKNKERITNISADQQKLKKYCTFVLVGNLVFSRHENVGVYLTFKHRTLWSPLCTIRPEKHPKGQPSASEKCWSDRLELWFWVTDDDLGVHGLTSLVESGSGVERRNSSRAISAADILSRATAWRVFSAQCSPNMARLKSASARRRCCSCFPDSSDRPWCWQGPKHRHKCWDGQHTQTGMHGIF